MGDASDPMAALPAAGTVGTATATGKPSAAMVAATDRRRSKAGRRWPTAGRRSTAGRRPSAGRRFPGWRRWRAAAGQTREPRGGGLAHE